VSPQQVVVMEIVKRCDTTELWKCDSAWPCVERKGAEEADPPGAVSRGLQKLCDEGVRHLTPWGRQNCSPPQGAGKPSLGYAICRLEAKNALQLFPVAFPQQIRNKLACRFPNSITTTCCQLVSDTANYLDM